MKVLVVFAGAPNYSSPGSVWLRRYFESWDVKDIMWYAPGSKDSRHGELWLPAENVHRNILFWVLHRAAEKTGWSVLYRLCSLELKMLLARAAIDQIVWLLELNNWRYAKYIDFRRHRAVGVLHDDLVHLQRGWTNRVKPVDPDEYRTTLSRFERLAVISETMRQRLHDAGIDNTYVFPPLASPNTGIPKKRPSQAAIRLGVIGAVYAPNEFVQLLEVFDESLGRIGDELSFVFSRGCHWKILERKDSFKHITFEIYQGMNDVQLDEVIAGLDAFFLNASFAAEDSELVATQFPSKIPVYLAHAKPIFGMCPPYSAAGAFLRNKPYAINISELSDTAFEAAFEQLLTHTRGAAVVPAEVFENDLQYFSIERWSGPWDAFIKGERDPQAPA